MNGIHSLAEMEKEINDLKSEFEETTKYLQSRSRVQLDYAIEANVSCKIVKDNIKKMREEMAIKCSLSLVFSLVSILMSIICIVFK